MLNAQEFVQTALSSILAETLVPVEVIVVDDGSTDNSRAKVEAMGDARVRIIEGQKKGIAAGLNLALGHARGGIIMRCDADDAYPPGRIAKQVEWLDLHPEDDAVCGAFTTIDETGVPLAHVVARDGSPGERIDPEIRRGIIRTHFCTFAIRRRVFEKVGVFREYFETAEDVDFQLRMGEACQICFLPFDAYFYRLHGTSITHSRSGNRRMFFDRMALEFHKQRLSSGTDALEQGDAPAAPRGSGDRSGVHKHVSAMLVGQAWRDLNEGRVGSSLRRSARAIATRPLGLQGWTNFAKILFRSVFPR
jgi:glycosyltransferase involved in cell wall biosynthesis